MGDMGELFKDLKEDKKKSKIRCFTDYPLFYEEYGKEAPIREVEFIKYDGNKYCQIKFGMDTFEVKSGYLYSKAGRLGEVPKLFETNPELKAIME